MKPKEVVLIGGEAYLHDGFFEITKSLAYHQIFVSMNTGGKGITPELAKKSADSGLKNVSISIDGLEPTHDLIRRNKGSFQSAMNTFDYFRNQGISIAANTHINRINKDELDELYQLLKSKGIQSWPIQITTPLGRASDGGIKGCPSLQSHTYIGGNIRNKSLKEIWEKSPELQINRFRTVESLSGFCRTFPFAKPCLGGCSFTAHSILGKTGNNPFCHFRAKSLAKVNIRERLVLKKCSIGTI